MSHLWSQVHCIADTVNANGDRPENLKAAVYDFNAMTPADKTRVLLELNVALLALQELSLLIASQPRVPQPPLS